jgi:beta-glucuronidase
MISSCKYTLLFLLLSIKLFSQDNQTAHWETSSLAPQQNLIRNVMNISGIWNFKVDSNQIGEQQQWYNGLSNTRPMAVPASWNDQYDELRDYLGHAWYEQNTYIPKNWQGQQILIRFG